MKKFIFGFAVLMVSSFALADEPKPVICPGPGCFLGDPAYLMCVSETDNWGQPSYKAGLIQLTFKIKNKPGVFNAVYKTYTVPANTPYYAPGTFVSCPFGYYANYPIN